MSKKFSKVLNSENGKLSALLQLIAFAFTRPGMKVITGAIKKKLLHRDPPPDYNQWIRKQLNITKITEDFNTTFKILSFTPTISIILVTKKPDSLILAATIKSIEDQLYTSWELCLAGSSESGLNNLPEKKSNAKIKIIQTEEHSLTSAINTAIKKTKGEYYLFLEPGALLTPDCLFEFVKYLNEHPDDEIIYCDDDRIDETGKYLDHYFKPGWSPDTLLSRNYIGDTFLISKKILNTIISSNENYQGTGIYDLLLRATEANSGIGNITKILFHKRHQPIKVIEDKETKNTLEAALKRRETPAEVVEIPGTASWRINYAIRQPGMVSIIIPTKDQAALLKVALSSIINKTSYTDYEILIINNNSTTPEFFSLMDEFKTMLPDIFRVIDAPGPFNFSRLMNLGIAASVGKYILLLNNDIEVTDAGWLTQMVSNAQNLHTGAVGVKLLYPDNTIQHAGIVLGIQGHSGHVFVNQQADFTGYHDNAIATTNYSALTAACLMCRKEVYLEAGGMDENLPVEFNDIALCLKFLELGYFNIYLASVSLYHHESATRSHPLRNLKSWKQHEHDLTFFKSKWQAYIDTDPFYNPNLSLNETDFRIKT